MRYTLPSIENNPSISQTPYIFEICRPLFKTNINHFIYCRFFFDNKSYIALSSDPAWVKNFYYTQYPSAGYEGKPLQAGIYFSSTLCNIGCTPQMIQDMQEGYNLWNPMVLLEINVEYYEMFIFSLPKVEYDTTNFYLNNIDSIKKFNVYFKDHAKKIIARACKEKIIMPKKFHDTFLINEEKSFNKINIDLPDQYQKEKWIYTNQINGVRLTNKELNCLNLLMTGKTLKTISELLERSQRTIEDHVNNLKCKLNVNSKAELIDLAFKFIKTN